MSKNLAVIGVGNMAKAIIAGIQKSDRKIESFYLYDINFEQYSSLISENIIGAKSIEEAIVNSDCVLLSVKPQNFPDILAEIKKVPESKEKLYITIAAGISVDYIENVLETKNIVRVLPNLPMVISKGVSAICYNDNVSDSDFELVENIFKASGSVIKINESDMNKIIGVTSSSPAYVFKFIKAVCDGALEQGMPNDGLINAVCDMIIGSAELIKSGYGNPEDMVKAVASKGGTTEKALEMLDRYNFEEAISKAMLACTKRADELGNIN